MGCFIIFGLLAGIGFLLLLPFAAVLSHKYKQAKKDAESIIYGTKTANREEINKVIDRLTKSKNKLSEEDRHIIEKLRHIRDSLPGQPG